MRLRTLLAALPLAALPLLAQSPRAQAKPKIHIAFQWHMHQPVYWPYESVVATHDAARWSYSLFDIFTTRTGPYTTWPYDAVNAGKDLEHLGAQVSFTGSLIENLDAWERSGRAFGGWKSTWKTGRGLTTVTGNPRLDLVVISYHHPLLPLIPSADQRLQIAMHRQALDAAFGPAAKSTRGMFPPETAFAEHLVPQLVAEGVQWVLVDNVHFDRARTDYPWNSGSNLYPPNLADQHDPKAAASWVALQNIWAPTKVSAPWGYQPHWVAHVDPETGATSRIIAVPAARYEGNEDARGGFGALQYEAVFSQLEPSNTDDAHPILMVLHHDGDNYGGGTDSYYHSNFGAFVAWVKANPSRFEATTVQDYLDRFPPAESDQIHVEPGSWSGADNGDPEFLKWNGKPKADGYSADRNSWGVIVAAANRVHTAQQLAPYGAVSSIVSGSGSETEQAWHFLLNGETSCYWYWDYSEGGKWDSFPARAANAAVAHADVVIGGGAGDTTPPTVFLPQREPYNPGNLEWGSTPQPSDFDVWTYAYDVSGLTEVTLHVRSTPNGFVAPANALYAGGTWKALPMTATKIAAQTDPAPKYKGDEYRVKVTGVRDALVDYYVSATDGKGKVQKTPMQHVYVGARTGAEPDAGPLPPSDAGPADAGPDTGKDAGETVPSNGVSWSPASPTVADVVTIYSSRAGKLHWGVDGWTAPAAALQPSGTVAIDAKAVETPLTLDPSGRWSVRLGPFTASPIAKIDFAVRHDDGTWNNNGGGDFHVTIAPAPATSQPSAGSSCGCATVGQAGGLAGGATFALFALGALARRGRARD